MTTQRHDGADSADGHGDDMDLQRLGAMLEYVSLLTIAEDRLRSRLAKLDPAEYFVVGPGRIRDWHVDGIVIGPTGVFLIWATWCRAEKSLWQNAELCRQYFRRDLPAGFSGEVEIMFASGSEISASVERVVFGPGNDLPGYNVLLTEGDVAQVIREWEPVQRLSPEWVEILRGYARPRDTCDGPAPQADPYPVMRPPKDVSETPGGW